MKSYARLFAGLAHDRRLRLLHLIENTELRVGSLQSVLRANQSNISRHLASLRQLGLVETRRDGKSIYYSLKQQPPKIQRLLGEILKLVAIEPEAQRDMQRLRNSQNPLPRANASPPAPNGVDVPSAVSSPSRSLARIGRLHPRAH